ncbi:21 kDa protein [Spatholobus suberectus]|nr:21 kDa protein [Spatholobus suberectus]
MAARLLPLSLVLNVILLDMSGAAESTIAKPPIPNPIIDFIKSSCESTSYPVTCIQSLLRYANMIHQNEQKLAIKALSVSVSKTRSCASFVKEMGPVKGMKPIEHHVVQECIEFMDDSVDRLSQSVRELGLFGKAEGKDFVWHMSNVKTWVSAAMTNQRMCLNGLDGPHVDTNLKATIRPRVVDVSQVTSNALALVNHFASKNRTTGQTKTPEMKLVIKCICMLKSLICFV